MGSLDKRLTALETRSQAAAFSWDGRIKAWDLMVDRARIKLSGMHDLLRQIPEPSAAWLIEMNREVTSEGIGDAREKLYSKFPDWRASLEELTDIEVYALKWDWCTWARPSQLIPGGDQVCLEDLLNAVAEHNSHANSSLSPPAI